LSGTAIRVAAAVEAYDQQFLPAWREYQDYLKSRYAPKAAALRLRAEVVGGNPRPRFRHRATNSLSLSFNACSAGLLPPL